MKKKPSPASNVLGLLNLSVPQILLPITYSYWANMWLSIIFWLSGFPPEPDTAPVVEIPPGRHKLCNRTDQLYGIK